jgi:hypothetical protein
MKLLRLNNGAYSQSISHILKPDNETVCGWARERPSDFPNVRREFVENAAVDRRDLDSICDACLCALINGNKI